jgi:DNA-binding transcriptional MerR regulator
MSRHRCDAMATVKDVAKELGVSERTVQRWTSALRQHLNGAIRQEGRRVVLSDDAVALLRQIRQLRDDGVPFNRAVAKVLGVEETDAPPEDYATVKDDATLSRRQSRQCDVVDVVIAVSCAVGALSLAAIAVALWLR